MTPRDTLTTPSQEANPGGAGSPHRILVASSPFLSWRHLPSCLWPRSTALGTLALQSFTRCILMCESASAPCCVCETYPCGYVYLSAYSFTSMHNPLYAYTICPSNLSGHVRSVQALVTINTLSWTFLTVSSVWTSVTKKCTLGVKVLDHSICLSKQFALTPNS